MHQNNHQSPDSEEISTPHDDHLGDVEKQETGVLELPRLNQGLQSDSDQSTSSLVVRGSVPTTDQRAIRQARLPHIEGKSLWLLMGCLFVALLLSTLEQLIVGVALPSIASELGEYDKSSWIVTSYLMAYNSFLMVFARGSDIFGRRTVFLVALAIFTIASLACGLANTMDQLIVFRAFQGVGGAGLYTLTLNVSTEITGKAKMIINILIPIAFGSSAGAAPVIGGAIVSSTTWRWVFLLNVPGGVLVAVIAFFVFPRNVVELNIKWRDLLRIDWLGVSLLIGAVQMLSFALQQGGTKYGWSSSIAIGTIVGQACTWAALFAWEWYLTKHEERLQILPLWPTRLWTGRIMVCAMLAAFTSGFPLYSIYIYLPQRYQLVDGLGPLMSGVNFLVTPVAAFIMTGVAASVSLVKNVSFYFFVAGAGLQAVGLGLMSTVGAGEQDEIPDRFYAYAVITGLGIGTCLSTITLISRAQSTHHDHSVNMSAISSLRTIGGTISISIGHIIVSDHLVSRSSRLLSVLTEAELDALVRDPAHISAEFTPEQVPIIRQVLGDAFKLNWKVMMGFALATFVFGCGCWVKNPVNLRDVDRQEAEDRRRLDQLAEEAKREQNNENEKNELQST